MKTAAQLKAEIKEIRGKYDAIFAKHAQSGDIPEADAEEMRAMDEKLEGLIAEYSARAQDEQRAANNREAMRSLFQGDSAPQPTSDGARAEVQELKSMGQRFVDDPEFKAWHSAMTSGGARPMSETTRVLSPTVELPGLFRESAALVTGLSSTSAGALVVNDRLNTIVPAVRADLNLLDLITRMPTASDTVEYVKVTGETNNAAPVLEATSTSNGAKPESAVALAVVTAVVETIAHWIPVTRRAASDARQLMAYIDDFLLYGLADALIGEIVAGSGTSPHLVGIANTSGVQAQAYSNSLLETTRKAQTLVRAGAKVAPTAYAMTPQDWEAIDLLQDNENRYYFGGPARMGVPVLWGLPVVQSDQLTTGVAYVADWRQAILWDREQANLLMTDSHSDFFIRNILVVLAEMRAGFGIQRPAAFVSIDMTAV